MIAQEDDAVLLTPTALNAPKVTVEKLVTLFVWKIIASTLIMK